MKNLLAENMLRFGTKNISESAVRQKLTEAVEALNTTFSLPTKKDAKGNVVYDKTGMIKYIAVAIPNPQYPGSTNHDNFKSFKTLAINDIPVRIVTSKKQTNGDISGYFAANEDAFKYLQGEVGKTATDPDSIYIGANLESGGVQGLYAAYKVNTYEVQTTPAPAPVKKN
jgi:hypothetical protein